MVAFEVLKYKTNKANYLSDLSCFFYILKPQDATIRSLFYTLYQKKVIHRC